MQIKILEVTKEGQIVRKTLAEPMSSLKNSLLEILYPGIEVARVQVPVEPLDTFQQALVEQALGNLVLDGKKFCLVGASGSAKNGKFYAVDSSHEKQVGAAVPALAGSCYQLLWDPGLRMPVRTDIRAQRKRLGRQGWPLGTNDCRGWISQKDSLR